MSQAAKPPLPPCFMAVGPRLPRGHMRKMAEANAGAHDRHQAATLLPREPRVEPQG